MLTGNSVSPAAQLIHWRRPLTWVLVKPTSSACWYERGGRRANDLFQQPPQQSPRWKIKRDGNKLDVSHRPSGKDAKCWVCGDKGQLPLGLSSISDTSCFAPTACNEIILDYFLFFFRTHKGIFSQSVNDAPQRERHGPNPGDLFKQRVLYFIIKQLWLVY